MAPSRRAPRRPHGHRHHRRPPRPAQPPRPTPPVHRDQSAENAAIHAAIDRERNAVAAGDANAYLAALTDDAVFMAPNVEAKTGPALRQFLEEFLRTVAVKWLSFEHLETVVVGDVAFHVFKCSWRTTPKAGGASAVMHFKGLHVLHRATDGRWRIRREIWNANPDTRPPF